MSRKYITGILFLLMAGNPLASHAQGLLWINQETKEDCVDVHAAFRGVFSLSSDSEFEIQLSGASWYRVWLDGELFAEGPDRYAPDFPLYQVRKLEMSAGKHLLAVQVHSEGLDTRILKGIDPFLYCRVLAEGKEMEVDWTSLRLPGYASQFLRVSAQFGWLEWADTRQQPARWQTMEFDDTGWESPTIVSRRLGEFQSSLISEVQNRSIPFKEIGDGPLASFFGYERDNPSARFFLRDQECKSVPPQGKWKRYDLGKVRLTAPRFILDLPEGAVVEFAFSESLRHGRVMPWINLSASDSYNMVHFKARGGQQEFHPLTPKGGRYVEMHIIAPPDRIKILKEDFLERGYHARPDGEFVTGDPLLNRIWQLGAETYMSCAEDALVDNPTRERGEWMGDVGIVGLQIGAAAFSDLGIIKSGLTHFAYSAREDGMVAGLAPGGPGYLSTFAALWTNANLYYWQVTGDKSLIVSLYPYAEKNIAAFEKYKTAEGISGDAGWAFVDWGYVPNQGDIDMGLNLIYYDALRAMIKWSGALDLNSKVSYYKDLAGQMKRIIEDWYEPFFQDGEVEWKEIGYHRTALGLRNGFIPIEFEEGAVASIKQHMMQCYPNNDEAPRLSDPGANNPQLITPYFAHYALPLLIERGEMDFVLDQYKACWGWMLEQGATTCLEVFDTRWSHCHQWAGCPTWQLSRYGLGLHPAFDRGLNSFDLNLVCGYLEEASGKVPLPDGNTILVHWKKSGDHIEYNIETPVKIEVIWKDPVKAGKTERMLIKKEKTIHLPLS
jgi:alpha-L-rhamnosidase